MKADLKLGPKCRFYIDDEDWLNLWDGYAAVSFPPEETEALRKFLAEVAATGGSAVEPKAEPQQGSPKIRPAGEPSKGEP